MSCAVRMLEIFVEQRKYHPIVNINNNILRIKWYFKQQ